MQRNLSVPVGCLLGLVLAAIAVTAADKEAGVKAEKVAYKGWKNNLRISNGNVELTVTLDVGPRIIGYQLAGGKNVFKEYADQLGKTGEPDWQIRGGHRLWVAPEDLTRTYAPDNGPVHHQEVSSGRHRFTPAEDKPYGVQREFDVRLAPKGSKATITHRITNTGDRIADLAVWSLSVMAPGGVEIVPLPPKKPHPGSPKNARSPADFAPNVTLALWPFFDFKDPRWQFGTKYITLRQDPKAKGPTKLGVAHKMGWIGYLNDSTLFVKRIPFKPGATYPDNGVNFETFTNEDMLEVESLGPLAKLEPGQSIEHVEEWELFGDIEPVKDETDIDKNVTAKIATK